MARILSPASIIVLSSIVLCESSVDIYAQSTTYERGKSNLEDIMPPTPEAASLVKYADVPFTHSTGTAELSIPLYTLEGRELKIPISLLYRSNGIKVDEIAGVAGLGWNLEAGGCITREVVYMPDEYHDGSFHYEQPSDAMLQRLQNNNLTTTDETWLKHTLWNRRDCGSDRYSYRVAGLSGSFIITPDEEIVQLSGDGVLIQASRVSLTDRSINFFYITGPDGTKYLFNVRETGTRKNQKVEFSTYATGQQVDWDATTAWYLGSITSADGTESATFTYSDGGTWNRNNWVFSQTLSYIDGDPNLQSPEGDPKIRLHSTYAQVESEYETKVLSTISLRGFTVLFDYESAGGYVMHTVSSSSHRQMNYPQRLSGMRVLTPAGGIIKSYRINTDSDSWDGRIMLDGINEYGRDSVLTDRWSFTYYKTSYNLTRVNRTSQDWYGYFNGENNDGFYLYLGERPNRPGACPYYLTTQIGNGPIYLKGGIPDSNQSYYLMLHCADHDGARTAFEYEGALSEKKYEGDSLAIGLRVKTINVFDGDSLVRTRSFRYKNPRSSGNLQISPEYYLTVNATTRLGSGTFSLNDWVFTLHEGFAKDGLGLNSMCVSYGKVTEVTSRVTGDADSTKTVYYYDTAPAQWHGANPANGFPSYWSSTYSNPSSYGYLSTINPYLAIPGYYYESGPVKPALLTRKDEYRMTGNGNQELLSSEIFEYNDSTPSTAVLVDYKAYQVMENGIQIGNINVSNDLMHYPVWVHTEMNAAPIRKTIVNYHESGNDTTVTDITYCPRANLTYPIRKESESVSGSDYIRSVSYTYPDTFTGTPPSWAGSLASGHILDSPVKTVYEKSHPGNGYVFSTIESALEYATFSGVTGASRPMLKRRTERRDGVLSWSDEIVARDRYGNPSSIKERGRPLTSLLWGYCGLYPVAIIENANGSQITTTLGSRTLLEDIQTTVNPTDAQLESWLSSLRTRPEGSLSAFYTWIPGVGISSMTDASGVKTSYSYDEAGRLAGVYDKDGALLESHKYHILNDGNNLRHVHHKTYNETLGHSHSASISWYNTLGMKVQDVDLHASGDGRDVVTAYEGDFMLHDDVKIWNPYPANADTLYQFGAPASSALYNDNAYAYTNNHYERSSRNRVESSHLPGYQGHNSQLSEDIEALFPRYEWLGDGMVAFPTIYYPSSEIVSTITRDPDGRMVKTVCDRFGRVLATAQGDTTSMRPYTYRLYDTKDRLRAVAGSGIAIGDTLNMWRYDYDSLGRMVSKGLPGCVREFYTYDDEDRVITIRKDSILLKHSYDGLGRLTKVYMFKDGLDSVLVEDHRYDTYPIIPNYTLTQLSLTLPSTMTRRGHETYVKMGIIGPDGQIGDYVDKLYIYNDKSLLDKVVYFFPDGKYVREEYSYDFQGRITLFNQKYFISRDGIVGPVISVRQEKQTMTQYDDWGRKAREITVLPKGGAISTELRDTTFYVYDDVGRLSSMHSSSGGNAVESSDTYTLQGFIKNHTSKVAGLVQFTESLKYETPDIMYAPVSYGGLITSKSESWVGFGENITVHYSQLAEGFWYDYAGRLIKDDSFMGYFPPDGILQTSGQMYTYDTRGNIMTRTNYTPATSSLTSYSYSGDRLTGGTVSTPGGFITESWQMQYDQRGRMTHETGDNRSIAYNYLDLPSQIKTGADVSVNYSYLADGMKISALTPSGEGLVYFGDFVYRQSSSGSLSFESVPFCAGRMMPSGVKYYLTDHLGSVRAVIDGATGNILEASDYTSYGDRTETNVPISPGTNTFRYHFTAKEDQETDFGLPFTDFGARQYSHTLHRWLVPDPMGEKYYDISPYAYCAGNPVMLVDQDGMDWERKWRSKTVTVSADIYTDRSSYSSAKQAAAYWNNRKDDTYVRDGRVYRVRYNIRVNRVDSFQNINKKDGIPHNRYIVEDFLLNPKMKNKAGETDRQLNISRVDKRYELTRPGTDQFSSTGAHEIGHLLGIEGHKDQTLMSTYQDDKRSLFLDQSQINQIIESPEGHDDAMSKLWLMINSLLYGE